MSQGNAVEPIAQLFCAKADELITRLMNRYLPAHDRGFVGDDRCAAPVAQDPYRVLGLARTATDPQIKRRVRELAKIFHPDLPTGNAEKMAEINDAAKQILDGRNAQ